MVERPVAFKLIKPAAQIWNNNPLTLFLSNISNFRFIPFRLNLNSNQMLNRVPFKEMCTGTAITYNSIAFYL